MSDIRSFFGGGGGKKPAATAAAAVLATDAPRKRVIADDDEEEWDDGNSSSKKTTRVEKDAANGPPVSVEKQHSPVKVAPTASTTTTAPAAAITDKKAAETTTIKPTTTYEKASVPKPSSFFAPVTQKAEMKLSTVPPIATSTSKAIEVTATPVAAGPTVVSTSIAPEVASIITWNAGEPVPYLAIVNTFDEISSKSGRIEKENSFCKLFRAVLLSTPADLETVVYLASNMVSPAYEGMELGIGDSLLVKAVCEATGRKREAVEEAYEREGDLGSVALASRASQRTLSFAAKPKPLSARHVLDQFRVITQIKGDKAQGRKVDVIKAIMIRCASGSSEAKYVVRALQGKLRIGTAKQTVLVALAHAFAWDDMRVLTKRIRDLVQESANSRSGGCSGADAEEEGLLVVVPDTGADPSNAMSSEQLFSILDRIKEASTPEATKMVSIMTEAAKTTRTDYFKSVDEPSADDKTSIAQILSKESIDNVFLLAEVAIKRAYSECPNLGAMVDALLGFRRGDGEEIVSVVAAAVAAAAAPTKKSASVAASATESASNAMRIVEPVPLFELYKACKLRIGIPVAPMLAKPTKAIGEVLRRLEGLPFTMEYKYDGERAQVHLLADGSVKIYSRNSEDNTNKYPDLQDVMRNAVKEGVTSCIVDAEVVAYDREKNCLLPFQVLSTRKRKVEAGEEDNQTVKIVLEVFDLLYINGKSLLRQTLRERRSLMHSAFKPAEGFFHFASGSDHVEDGDTAPIEAFLQESCTAMCEGLMVKTLDDNASYEPSKRSLNWLKLKKDYIDGMGVCDSVDLVVLGGYLGRGKRVNTYGAYLMACYDPESDEYQSVCKVGTGFKDEDLARLYEQMKKHVIPSKKRPTNYNAGDALEPDDWFHAAVVWELQAADLSRSSVHRGGVGNRQLSGHVDNRAGEGNIRGIGLRFPRYLRDRPDKRPDDATSSEQIVDMFFSQSGIEGGDGAALEDDDDDFEGI